MPKEWLPPPALPYTVIIDDTDLDWVPVGPIHTQPVVFRALDDALAWGPLSDRIDVSNDPVASYDGDSFAVNTNLHNVDTARLAYGSVSLERLLRCAPPLPPWLPAGLLRGHDFGLFRECFALFEEAPFGAPLCRLSGRSCDIVPMDSAWRTVPAPCGSPRVRRSASWGRLKKKKKMKVPVPPLGALFAERPPPGEGQWACSGESEAGLWGPAGP